MPTKANPIVTVMLDKERHLKYNFNAMAAFTEATGKNLFKSETIRAILQDLNPYDFRALTWACLVHEDKTLTLDQVGDLLDLETADGAVITRKLLEAIGFALPEPDKEEKQAIPLVKKLRKNGTG